MALTPLWFSQALASQLSNDFQHLKEPSTHHSISVAKTGMYLKEHASEFSVGFQNFQHFGLMFSFLIKPDNFDTSDIDLTVFQWMGVEDLEMQLI